MQKLTLLVIFGLFSSSYSQNPANCQFTEINGKYVCSLQGTTVIFEEKANDPIEGVHNSGKGPSDVQVVLSPGASSEYMLKRLFNNFTNLEEIEFANGDVKKIENEFFFNCDRLTTLTINKGVFATIGGKAFENCAALKKITLNGNSIASFDTGAFDGLAALEELDLSGNQIRVPAQGIFNPLKELKVFKLSSNKFDSLPNQIFSQNTKLVELYLDNNLIKQLLKVHVEKTKSLQILSFKNNSLDKVERGFFDGISLASAYFIDNSCVNEDFPTVNQDDIKSKFEECFKRNGAVKFDMISNLLLVAIGTIVGLRFF